MDSHDLFVYVWNISVENILEGRMFLHWWQALSHPTNLRGNQMLLLEVTTASILNTILPIQADKKVLTRATRVIGI